MAMLRRACLALALDDEVADDRAAIAAGRDRAFEAAIAWACQPAP